MLYSFIFVVHNEFIGQLVTVLFQRSIFPPCMYIRVMLKHGKIQLLEGAFDVAGNKEREETVKS